MTPLSLFEKPKSKAKRIEEKLRSKGLGGASNIELNHISFRYGAIIFRLRQEGHHIVTGATDKHGKVIYYWHY